jgi:hypothetical protein
MVGPCAKVRLGEDSSEVTYAALGMVTSNKIAIAINSTCNATGKINKRRIGYSLGQDFAALT